LYSLKEKNSYPAYALSLFGYYLAGGEEKKLEKVPQFRP
jgi:hypothetical protein